MICNKTQSTHNNFVYNNILEAIGKTPLIKLNRIGAELDCQFYVKAEFFNPGSSVKDRIGPAIIEEAEYNGTLQPGGTIIEATSGNTGVGLAPAAIIKGYHCIFVVSEKVSQEKVDGLRAFGAEVIVTPANVDRYDPRSYESVAKQLAEEPPNAILANQFENPMNPQAHYLSTGPELYAQLGTRITHFVAGMGSGGTITGTGRYLKEVIENVRIVGVDPVGSILADLYQHGRPQRSAGYLVEGIGQDFHPSILDFSVIDEIVRVSDRDGILMTRRLLREEGLFAGGSSGTAVAAAIHYAREHHLGSTDTLVVLLPDSGSRYLSKIFHDSWMREHGLMDDFDAIHESEPEQVLALVS